MSELRQRSRGDCVFEARSTFARAYDYNRDCALRSLLRFDGQRALAYGRIGGNRDPVGEAGAR